MTFERSQSHVTFIPPNEPHAEPSATFTEPSAEEIAPTSEPSATFTDLQSPLHLPSLPHPWRGEGSEGEGRRSAPESKPQRTPSLSGGKAGRRAARRAERAYTERQKRAPRVIGNFHTVVSRYVLERLAAGLEPTEDGMRAAQERIWVELDAKEREEISIAGLEHPKAGPAFNSAISIYLDKNRIREAHRRCTSPCAAKPSHHDTS